MTKYIFNVMTSVVVEAEDKDKARQILDNDGGDVRDRDVLLVDEEVSK